MIHGMQKTTVYIAEDLKRAPGQVAAARGVSEAELIREALHTLTSQTTPPCPRLPLFKSGKPPLTERVDEALVGCGVVVILLDTSGLLPALDESRRHAVTDVLGLDQPHFRAMRVKRRKRFKVLPFDRSARRKLI